MKNKENRNIMKTKAKEARNGSMPWEQEYGYAQAVKLGGTVWVAGQLGTDEKGILQEGMEKQMQQTYVNIEKLLVSYGMTMDDVVEEVLYVTDIETAFEARKKAGRMSYPNAMEVPGTMVEISRLALPQQVVEIKIIAKKTKSKSHPHK